MILHNRKIYGRFIGQPISAGDLFADLPPTTKKKIASIQERKEIKEGETISKMGSFPENLYVLVEGKAQMSLKNELTRKNSNRLINKGEIIGLTQYISGSPNEMNVLTLSTCFLDIFPAKDFLNFLKEDPQLCFRLVSKLSSDIQSNYKIFSSMIF